MSKIFADALSYPDFFHSNLNDPNRVLKVLVGELSWARAFYYQLFKLIFQLEGDQQKSVNYAQQLVNLARQSTLKVQEPSIQRSYSESISMIENFIHGLLQNQDQQFEEEINNNPAVDEAIVKILSLIVKEGGFEEGNSQQKMKYLGYLFEEHIDQFEKGLKFEQSDTFFYFENDNLIYIAFLNLNPQADEKSSKDQRYSKDEQQVEVQQYETKNVINYNQYNQELIYSKDIRDPQFKPYQQEKLESPNFPETHQNVLTSMKPMLTPNQQQQDYDRADYLFLNKYRSNSKQDKMIKIEEESTSQMGRNNQADMYSKLERKTDSENYSKKSPQFQDLQFTLGKKQSSEVNHYNGFNSVGIKSVDFQSSTKNKNFQSLYEKKSEYERKYNFVGEKPELRSQYEERPKEHDQLFYKPLNAGKKSPKSSTKSNNLKKDPLDICNDSEKGTFYRKFTDTKILNILAEPYRTKIKMLKNRFAGVHSRDYRSDVRHGKV